MTAPLDLAELRFLVVEDHGFQRWVLGNLLERMGATRVFQAEDGAQALALLQEMADPVDVVVSDLDMPGMDGMEFIRHLAAARPGSSLILTSGLDAGLISSVSAMAQAYGIHILGVVQKPVTERKLQEILALYRPRGNASRAARRVFTAEDVATALSRGEIEAFFQPKVELATGGVTGAEALARWRHPQDGVVLPGEFIPVLERSPATMHALTMTMVEAGASHCAAWRAAGHDLTIAVNLSPTLFADMDIVDQLLECIAAHAVEPRSVVIEVTESAMATNIARSLEILARMRMLGFGLSIDDYGTGYSSLQQLSRVAFTELKIDRSFIREAPRHHPSRVVLESSLEIASRLGIVSVAEGIETRQEAELVAGLGCRMAQGFHYARPMPGDEMAEWLRQSRRRGG